jgi:putative copper resistance protein D
MIGIFAAMRWLHEGSLMLLFGGAALRALLAARLPALALPPLPARLIVALVAMASAVAWLGLATAQMAGDNAACLDLTLLKLTVTQTLFGQLFLARFALLVLLCAGLVRRWRESAIALLSGLGLALISVTSHAAEASPAHFTAIGTVSDSLHLLTGGFWLGGLAVLALLFRRGADRALLASATAIFAEWGMIAVTILVMTGMLSAATILLGGEGHDAPLYLAVLGAKLALVAIMIGLALFNHFRLLPRLAEDKSAALLSRHINWELGLITIVVALAALLGLLAPTG